MTNSEMKQTTHRREFLGSIAAGTAALGLATFASPLTLHAEKAQPPHVEADADEWFNKIKGKHRMVFDVTQPHDVFPFAWPKVFLMTNDKTGTPEKDCNAVVVLRHTAIPYAMEDRLWSKYKFGEVFKIDDAASKAPSLRNAFWKPKPGDFKIPGIGPVPIGINELQDSGVMFCVCEMALIVYSAVVAQSTNQDAAEVKKDWVSGILPGIQIVPSGVWALGRAQERGCGYCFAG